MAGGNAMKKALTIVSSILLLMGLGLSLAAASQKGGLPALELRVQALEDKLAALISHVGSAHKDIVALKIDVATLKIDIAALKVEDAVLKGAVNVLTNSVLDLKLQNNWAVVDSSASVVRYGGASKVTAARTGTGMYEVTVGKKDVTGCAYNATIGDVGKSSVPPGFITVSGGLANNLTDVMVRTYDKSGMAADSSFQLFVSCR
jgi:hypothetical protein